MKFNLRKTIVKIIFLSSTVITFSSATAQTIDYSLLVGEWSFPKMCEQKRHIYTNDGQYIWIEKKEEVWQIQYRGVYVIKPEINLVVIAEGHQQDGFGFKTIELNNTTYRARDVEDNTVFSFQRCPNP